MTELILMFLRSRNQAASLSPKIIVRTTTATTKTAATTTTAAAATTTTAAATQASAFAGQVSLLELGADLCGCRKLLSGGFEQWELFPGGFRLMGF